MILVFLTLFQVSFSLLIPLEKEGNGLFSVKSCFSTTECAFLVVDTTNSNILVKADSINTSLIPSFKQLSEEEAKTSIGPYNSTFYRCESNLQVENETFSALKFGLVTKTEAPYKGILGVSGLGEESILFQLRDILKEPVIFLDLGKLEMGLGNYPHHRKIEETPFCSIMPSNDASVWKCDLDSILVFDQKGEKTKFTFKREAILNTLFREIFIQVDKDISRTVIGEYLRFNDILDKCDLKFHFNTPFYICHDIFPSKMSPMYFILNKKGYRLEGKDLFEYNEGKYIFMVKGSFSPVLSLGTIFMDKFGLILDFHQKKIQFYSGEWEEENEIQDISTEIDVFKAFFVLVSVFVVVGMGVIVFYHYSSKIRSDSDPLTD